MPTCVKLLRHFEFKMTRKTDALCRYRLTNWKFKWTFDDKLMLCWCSLCMDLASGNLREVAKSSEKARGRSAVLSHKTLSKTRFATLFKTKTCQTLQIFNLLMNVMKMTILDALFFNFWATSIDERDLSSFFDDRCTRSLGLVDSLNLIQNQGANFLKN